MTPLMNAAYRGKAEMCELLLANGANVNSNQHEHQVKLLNTVDLMFLFHFMHEDPAI